MDLALTLSGLLLCGGGAIFCLWKAERERKAYVPGRVWRVPYLGLAVVLTTAVVALLAHTFSLLTGSPLPSRRLGF